MRTARSRQTQTRPSPKSTFPGAADSRWQRARANRRLYELGKKVAAELEMEGDPVVTGLMSLDLEKSGIELPVIRGLGLRAHPPEETAKLLKQSGKFAVPSYSFPYLLPNGKPMTYREGRQRRAFYRFRLLFPVVTGTKENGQLKEIRYMQPPGSGTHLYLPQVTTVDWQKVVQDTSVDILLTEGEKKAIAGTVLLYRPTISWPGVNAVNKADLDLLKWDGRRVTIVFDSPDWLMNPRVRVAEQQRGRELANRGARVFFKHLPKPSYLMADTISDEERNGNE